ncbi:MAG: T9SS type A sorting domain-containing protein, partial [Muribaculaceae bacterium]|nr:T9SS type A sorting domain-containing protein [Muribaculaceae bacterium]
LTMKISRYILSLGAFLLLLTAPLTVAAADAQQAEVVLKQDAPQVKVRPGGISIDLPGDAVQHVQIYALTGQVVKQFDAAPGQTVVDLPAGYYIVRVSTTTVKVAVK